MNKNRKLPVQIAFQMVKGALGNNVDYFEKVKIKSSQKDNLATLELINPTPVRDMAVWGSICEMIDELITLWNDKVSIKLNIKPDFKGANIKIKAL